MSPGGGKSELAHESEKLIVLALETNEFTNGGVAFHSSSQPVVYGGGIETVEQDPTESALAEVTPVESTQKYVELFEANFEE